MKVGPFTLTRTKSLDLQRKALGPLAGVDGSRGWWPLIRDMVAGGWQRNEEVSIDSVLSNPTLYACVTLIAGDMAKLRPMLVEQDEDGIWNEIENTAHSPVLRRPNGYQGWVDYAEWYVLSKLVHGNAYVLKARDASGIVRSLYILDPYRVKPLVAPDGSVFYQLENDTLADIQNSVIVPAREMIHDVMCPLFHPLCGVSPIYAAGFPAMQGLNIRAASDKFFRNGSRPGGLLLVPGTITQVQADEMKANWKTAFSGDNQGDIAVLTAGMKYEAMAMSAEQARLVEQLRMTDEDIARCFHMPRHKVGIGPDPTFTNIGPLNQQYYTDCLQKHITKFQAKHTAGLELWNVPGKTLAVELDLDDLLMMDMLTKSEVASKAITSGLSFNEARLRFYDVGPVRGGESPLAQQQNYSLEALAKRDASADPFGTAKPAPDPAPAEEKAMEMPFSGAAFESALLELVAA